MNRTELDVLVERHQLSRAGIELALELAHARPSAAAVREFAVRLLRLAGVLSLAAGVIFFVAANWQELQVFGRFALLQSLFLGAVAVAFWQPPPRTAGRFGVLAAFIVTGALLALFGQTYQTGADVYELFLSWALLGAVFAIAGQWSVVCAAWVFVLNVAFVLFCGFQPHGGLFWLLFGAWSEWGERLLLLPALVNLLLWMGFERMRKTPFAHLAPSWLSRFILACALMFVTWSGCFAILADEWERRARGPDGVALSIVAIMLGGVGAYSLRRRADVFPLTLTAAALIAFGVCGILRANDVDSLGVVFAVALWLVVASTVAGRMLTGWAREWRGQEEAA